MPLAKTEVVNLINVLGLLINLFKSAENIHFNFLFDHSMQYLIFADRDQISRAFTNLIKNGIQSIGESPNGKIEIRIIRIDKLVTIEIEDNGCGIPEEIYPKMFHPNFTTKSSGTGLGLAFVKNVIKQIGGEIRFNSIVNRGTTFIIEIPVD
jgi:two-component system nitrogen regulation sensor histidine kinase NtrY